MSKIKSLRKFHEANEGQLGKRIKKIDRYPCNDDLEQNIDHLQSLLSEKGVPTEECDSCRFISSGDYFEYTKCDGCGYTLIGCKEGKCTERFHFSTLDCHYCVECMRKANKKRKRANLSEVELYQLKVKKIEKDFCVKCFPYFEEENISSDMVGMSHTLREENESKENPYFKCGICESAHPMNYFVGNCGICEKKLGLCCYYENQWCDRIGKSDKEEFKFASCEKFLCPLCLDEESISSSSSSSSEGESSD